MTTNITKRLLTLLFAVMATMGLYAQQTVTLIDENFSKFTAGSEETPDFILLTTSEHQYIPAKYTQTPGWEAYYVYQAGGACYMSNVYGYKFHTPAMNLVGNITVTAKMRLHPNETATSNNSAGISIYEKDGSGWSSLASIRTEDLTTEWAEFTLTAEITSEMTTADLHYISIAPTFSRRVLIDDVKVTKTVPDGTFLPPVAKAPTGVSTSGFTANWNPASGADGYLLSVYQRVYNNEIYDYEKVFVHEDLSVSGTNYAVTGLNEEETYFYYVKAKQGSDTSVFSNLVPVFTAETDDEPLLDEDFSGFTAGTIDVADGTDIGDEYLGGTGELNNLTQTTGWSGYGIHQAAGTCVVLGVESYGDIYSSLSSPNIAIDGAVKAMARIRIYPGSEAASTTLNVAIRERWSVVVSDTWTISREWQEFSIDASAIGSYYFQISGSEDNFVPYQIDWIMVEKSSVVLPPNPPAVSAATGMTATGFTANWARDASATGYLLYVTYEEDGETKLFEDGREVAQTDYSDPAPKVTGLDPEVFYSYYAKTKRGDQISEASGVIEVLHIPAVKTTAATNISETGFTANWEQAPKSTGYKLVYYRYDLKWGRVPMGTINVDGKETTSYEITGLNKAQAVDYVYEVTVNCEKNGQTLTSAVSNRTTVSIAESEDITYELLFEDFSKFVNGSEEEIYRNPDYDQGDPQSPPEGVSEFNTWIIPDSYTLTPGWKGIAVYEAGGVAAMTYSPYPNSFLGGYIQTPPLAMTSKITVSFKARVIPQYKTVPEGETIQLPVFCSDVSYNTIDIDAVHGSTDIQLTNEWKEFSFTFYNSSTELAYINFGRNYEASPPFFIDDIRLTGVVTSLDEPVATSATDFTYDGFTAHWEEVEYATEYLLSVYRRVSGQNQFALEDHVVEGNSFIVTGLENPDADYSYYVKAKGGSLVSEQSNTVIALGISQPVIGEATAINGAGFTANWDATPKASRYDLSYYKIVGGGEPALIETIGIDGKNNNSYVVTGLNISETDKYAYDVIAYYDTSSDTYTSEVSDRAFVTIAIPTYTITATAGEGGSINPSGTTTLEEGSSQTYTISAGAGYLISQVLVDGESKGVITTYTFENITANHTIEATFVEEGVTEYTITATAGEGGSINPSGAIKVEEGKSQTFTITAATDYEIDKVMVDGVDKGAIATYTFENVTTDHTIEAIFKKGTAIDDVKQEALKVYTHDGDVYVKLTEPALIQVYSVNGKTVASVNGHVGENVITLPKNAVYIVRVNNQKVKIIL